MTEKIEIRTGREGDAEEVLKMIVEHARFEGEAFEPLGKLDKLRQGLREQSPFESMVVEKNGRLEGYCTYMPHYDSWHQQWYLFVDGLWLNGALRGKSIGTQIFDRLHARAIQLDCVTIQVLTPCTNDSGISFYKKLGASQSDKAYFSLPVRK